MFLKAYRTFFFLRLHAEENTIVLLWFFACVARNYGYDVEEEEKIRGKKEWERESGKHLTLIKETLAHVHSRYL